MAASVWTALVKALSACVPFSNGRCTYTYIVFGNLRRLVEQLELIGWPKPVENPVDWSEAPNEGVAAAFVDLLTLEKMSVCLTILRPGWRLNTSL